MGLLNEGSPLSWEETKALADHVREHGIAQFIYIYHSQKDRQGDELKWGDEVEYMIVKFDDEKKLASVALKARDLLPQLNRKELNNSDSLNSLWRPEYADYMIESSPGKPFGSLMAHYNLVEHNMRFRREEVNKLLQDDERLMTITSFPRLGTPNFTYPVYQPQPENPLSASRSLYFPDEAIYPGHSRFKTLTRNIRMRRGEKVTMKTQVFLDIKTKLPVEGAPPGEDNVVLLDAMGFGMGCCCLQLTFQACNITEARFLYDQLAPLCPIMLALTAASPIFRGYLTNSDCRWNVISSLVDCRNAEERGLVPLKHSRFRIAKSRYDSIDTYLSPEGALYNDVPVTYDEYDYQQLIDGGVDHLLAQHVAHLFIRDPLILLSNGVHLNDQLETDHFENIQSSNWQTMRFKPPPPNTTIGWRIEFRPCEVQITDFENAAIACFVMLLSRVILSYDLNFLMPISKVEENMQVAQYLDACRREKFWFRRSADSSIELKNCPNVSSNTKDGTSDLCQLMTINEIFNGKAKVFPGLVPLIRSYLQSMEVDTDTHCTIEQYLRLIEKRAAGELVTTATWMRHQVLNHPEYKKDSVVTERINYDLIKRMQSIQEGTVIEPDLLGRENHSKTKDFIPAALQKHLAKGDSCEGN